MNKDLKTTIEDYLNRGWSVFPINVSGEEENGKIKKTIQFPAGGWKRFQEEKISKDKIEWEWMQFSGVGIVTGKISGITVIDFDNKDKSIIPPDFFNTFCVETPKGFHFFFNYYPDARQTQNTAKHIDIRNDGGFVIAPPTAYSAKGKEFSYKNNKIL